jgi:hypothetical protein
MAQGSAYAYQLEEPDRPGGRPLVDVLVGGSTLGVCVRRADQQHYQRLTWGEIELVTLNPLTQLIGETIAGKAG